MKKDGTELDATVFTSKEDAVIYADVNNIKGIDDHTFPEILKFFPSEAKAQTKPVAKALDEDKW